MISLFKNKFLGLLALSLINFPSFGQTISQAVMNVDNSNSPLSTETCVSVRLVVDYITGSGGHSVASPIYNLTDGETKVLQANLPIDVKNTSVTKKLIFYTDSHDITYTVPGSGIVSENYNYIESCGIGIPQLYWTLTLGGSPSLVTYYIHQ